MKSKGSSFSAQKKKKKQDMKLASLILAVLMASAVFVFTSKYAFLKVKIVLDKNKSVKEFSFNKIGMYRY